jgi:tRNA G18 (ribose-2'-O)-methylase SpoU
MLPSDRLLTNQTLLVFICSHITVMHVLQVWVALDEVQDPQNLGAILRNCYYFGATGVIVCGRNRYIIYFLPTCLCLVHDQTT